MKTVDIKLATKIYNVMCETESLEKDMVVGKGANAYKAISEATVLNAIKPLFKKYKLIIFPSKATAIEITEQYPDQYESTKIKLKSLTQITTTFTLVDAESGESIDIEVIGNGFDSLDKGSGKATTYAFKTALSKTFMLFSGEDTDNTHSDEIHKPPAKPINKSSTAQVPVQEDNSLVSINEIMELEQTLTNHKRNIKDVLEKFKIKSIQELKVSQFKWLMGQLK